MLYQEKQLRKIYLKTEYIKTFNEKNLFIEVCKSNMCKQVFGVWLDYFPSEIRYQWNSVLLAYVNYAPLGTGGCDNTKAFLLHEEWVWH
jgi:hypothetical protein